MDNPANLIDHTLLSPGATETQIQNLCEEAVEYGFASVCIPPVYVPVAANLLYGSDVKVCTVVGFPCGYTTTRNKVQETSDLIAIGADEIDMVIQIGWLLNGQHAFVEDEIAQVVITAMKQPVKVIIECCFLSDELKRQAARLVVNAGADFVKTSTGFGPAGATLDDVTLLTETVKGAIKVKAAGGIRSLADIDNFIQSGATRIGSSSGVAIMKEWQELEAGY
jgi:deoxyribose-phosphate aldolase